MFHPILRRDERNLRRAPGRSGNSISVRRVRASVHVRVRVRQWAQRNVVVTIEKKNSVSVYSSGNG
jgi:hypothetical protein